ncbi:MAG: TraB/GumN family protein [Dehalococcoidales bacterium]|nr:TraB/GumN family protein [Dehalococcoidales bacterium]
MENTPGTENNVIRLVYKDKEIVLIGTAHVSKESAELVKRTIDEEKPDSICIELDENRYQNLQNPKAWEQTDVVHIIKTKRTGFLLANLVLGSFQKKIARQLGTVLGQEMLQGIKSAEETGAKLVLADRDIKTTFMHIWRKLGLWEKTKLFFNLRNSKLSRIFPRENWSWRMKLQLHPVLKTLGTY